MYEIFEQLMKTYGYTAYKVSVETGIAQSTLSDWKKGKSTPKADKLQKIADLFNVSLEYLMTGEDKSSLTDNKYYINEETAEMANKILHNKELKLLFSAAQDAAPEDIATIHQMLLALKRKERGDID